MPAKVCVVPACNRKRGLNSDGVCPSCAGKEKRVANSSTPLYPCGVCQEECKEKEPAVMCEYCTAWSHIECVDISNDDYKVLKKLGTVKWFCKSCDKTIDEVKNSKMKPNPESVWTKSYF